MDGKNGDGLHFEKFSLNFFKVLISIFKAKPKVCHGLFFFPKIGFKVMFWVVVKATKKDFCTVLPAKQQKCHDRALMIYSLYKLN